MQLSVGGKSYGEAMKKDIFLSSFSWEKILIFRFLDLLECSAGYSRTLDDFYYFLCTSFFIHIIEITNSPYLIMSLKPVISAV